MNKNTLTYTIISLLSLIYLFFFSSNLLVLTNFNSVFFNLVSTVLVFLLLDLTYKLYIRKFQLNTKELVIYLVIYLIISLTFILSNQLVSDPKFNFNPIPNYFIVPSKEAYIFLVTNIVFISPIGYFYHRYNLKFSLMASIIFFTLLQYLLYILKINDFSIATIIIHLIGFYLGYFYFQSQKKKSKKWDNISYDIRLLTTFIIILFILFNFIKNFL